MEPTTGERTEISPRGQAGWRLLASINGRGARICIDIRICHFRGGEGGGGFIGLAGGRGSMCTFLHSLLPCSQYRLLLLLLLLLPLGALAEPSVQLGRLAWQKT